MSEPVPMRCRNCGQTNGLYQTGTIGAWQGITAVTDGIAVVETMEVESYSRDTDGWHTFEREGYGCTCGNEHPRLDGLAEPDLPEGAGGLLHPEQTRLETDADAGGSLTP